MGHGTNIAWSLPGDPLETAQRPNEICTETPRSSPEMPRETRRLHKTAQRPSEFEDSNTTSKTTKRLFGLKFSQITSKKAQRLSADCWKTKSKKA